MKKLEIDGITYVRQAREKPLQVKRLQDTLIDKRRAEVLEEILAAMNANGITFVQLAKESGINYSNIRGRLNGNPTLTTLLRISAAIERITGAAFRGASFVEPG